MALLILIFLEFYFRLFRLQFIKNILMNLSHDSSTPAKEIAS